jgi:tetratricopeptide (TPR) repeat protein
MALLAWCIWYLKFRPTTEQLMRQGIHAAERSDRQSATRYLDAVLSREPAHAQALLIRGQLAREAGETQLAQELWKRIPDTPEIEGSKARHLEGAMLLDAGNARAGERSLLRAIELNPAYLPAREMILRMYIVQRRIVEIRAELLGILEFRAWTFEELLLFSLGSGAIEDIETSQPALEKFIAADPNDVASRLGLAKCYISLGRGDEAEALLRAGLRDHPREPALIGLLAEQLLDRSDLTAAAKILAIELHGDNSDLTLLRSLGNYALETHDSERAMACFRAAVALEPFDRACNYKLGLLLEAQGKTADGSIFLHRARLLGQLTSKLEIVSIKRRQAPQEFGQFAVETAQTLAELNRPVEASLWVNTAVEYEPTNRQARELSKHLNEKIAPRTSAAVALAREFGLRNPTEGSSGAGQNPAINIASPPQTNGRAPVTGQIRLRDCHESAGVEFRYFAGDTGNKYLIESMGGGVAVLDYDGDGWPDLYFTQGARIPLDPTDETYRDRLFRNLGDGRFQDETLSSGLGDARYSQGCAAGDIDNDGDPDLIVANWGEISLYVNNGDGTFVEAARNWGLSGSRWHASLALADFDRDGNLDLYAAAYLLEPLRRCRTIDGRIAACDPRNYDAEPDVLYHNKGNGWFDDVSVTAGVLAPDGKGLGLIVTDLNRDGWPDLYVANDGTPNFLFRNLGSEGRQGIRFVEQGLTSGAAVNQDGLAQASMGIACADFNGDGLPDMYVTNFYMEGSAFYLNQGNFGFVDAVRSVGLYAPTRHVLGFGTQAVDFDLDGWPDLFSTNGHIDDFRFRGEPWKMPPQVFRNRRDGSFEDVSRDCGEFFHGLYLGRGAARTDWDRDGKPDVVVSHLDAPAALLRNESKMVGNALILELRGVVSNRDAIGTILEVTIGSEIRVYEICGGDGYYASNDRRQVIGVGNAEVIDRLEIHWPSGKVERRGNLAAGRNLFLIEGRVGEEF